MSDDVPFTVTTTTCSSGTSTTTTSTTSQEIKPAKEGGGGGETEEEGGESLDREEEGLGAENTLRGRRKLENADSSYDSDFDPKEEEQHGDVYRTVSDTLGAEFAEYVTKYSPHTPTHSSSTSSHSTITPPPVSSTLVISSVSHLSPSLKSSPTSASGDHDTATTTTTTTTTTAAAATTTTTASSTTTTTTTPAASTTTTTATAISTTTTTTSTTPTQDESITATTTTTTTTIPLTPATTTPTTTTTKDTTPATNLPALTSSQPHLAPRSETESGVGPRTREPVGEVSKAVTLPAPINTISTTTTTTTAATTTATTTTTLHQRPSYASQVEFGIKLGYSEGLVQLALTKLGATPDKDDLLAELIRLGTTNLPRADGGGGGGGGSGGGGGGSEGEDREEMLLVSSSTASSTSLHQHHLHHLVQHPHLHHLHMQQEQQQQQQQQQTALRPIIIDGSNVAMSHGNKSTFSCHGLRVCVEWFRARGHGEITVFVPAWRKEAPRWDTPIADQEVLLELERERVLVFTPSRVCGGKRIVSYDDRYILKEAVESGGVVVSNDNYRDLVSESPGFRRVVEENLLMYSWVNGRFVPPDDPLGRSGPTLDVFLRRSSLRDKDKQAPCPYGRKCTYGNKCKYKHPERGTAPLKSVTERLQEQAQRHYQNKAKSRDSSPGESLRGSLSLPVCAAEPDVCKKPLTRTQSIVPTVSLTLPSALTQDTPTHDHSPATTPATSAPSHHHLMPPPLDPLRSATLYKSDSALYHLYPSQPAPGPPGYGSSAWGWEGAQQGAGAGHYGSHMPLGKQQSDPDQQDNPHRKLQRQLTLNPSYDSRLYRIHGFREPAPEHFPLGAASTPAPGTGPSPGQSQGQGSPNRVGRGAEGSVFTPGQGRASPGYSSGPYAGREQVHGGLHTPLARQNSQDGGKHLASLPPHLYPSYSHPHVTRFSSAPDPIWGGPHQPAAATPPLITRLNSTSDTRLNLYAGDSHYIPDVYEDPLGRPTSYAPMPHPPGPSQGPGPVTPAPGPVGSRPMSPQSTALHHSPSVSPRGHTPPQQQAPGGAPPQGAPTSSFPPPGHEDTRLRVFYHLSQLFPEAQVRAVMTQHPEETDPQKICSYILAAAGQGGSRPMSPQHQTAAPPPQPPASPYLLKAFPGSPLATTPASHEDARLRAFYHLSQLFPEAEVRAVLARAPNETDIQQFCAALLARRANQQS